MDGLGLQRTGLCPRKERFGLDPGRDTTCKSEQLRQEKDPMLLRPAMDALWNLTFHEQVWVFSCLG